MIYFIVKKEHSYTFDELPHSVSEFTKVLFYENLAELNGQPIGPVIFTDHDRLTKPAHSHVVNLCNLMEGSYSTVPILNHPNKVLLRFDLLKKLQKEKINSFNVFRTSDNWEQINFPVFVRAEHVHTYKNGLRLAADWDQLREIIARHVQSGFEAQQLIITEYCDISDAEGVFNKYAAFYLNGIVLPRHIFFAREWYVSVKSVSESLDINVKRFKTQADYVENNPHAEWIKRIFELAGTDYGRIDYGVKDGIPQAWEINLNPHLSANASEDVKPGSLDEKRLHLLDVFNEQFVKVLNELNEPFADEKNVFDLSESSS